jgi:hypothetical protein
LNDWVVSEERQGSRKCSPLKLTIMTLIKGLSSYFCISFLDFFI